MNFSKEGRDIMEKIQELFFEVKQRMEKDGFPLSDNIVSWIGTMNTKRSLGRCTQNRHGEYRIAINKKLVEVADTEQDVIKSVLTHELIHTIRGCMNHSSEFKRYANRANSLYPEVNVSTHATQKEHEVFNKIMANDAPYAYKCLACGHETLLYKKTSFVKQMLGEERGGHVCYTCRCHGVKQENGVYVTSFVLTKNKGKKVFIMPKNLSKTFAPQKQEEVFYSGNEILLFDPSQYEEVKSAKKKVVACATKRNAIVNKEEITLF